MVFGGHHVPAGHARGRVGLLDQVVGTTRQLRSDAQRQAITTGVIIAAILVIAFLTSLLIARSMIGPLRRLQAGARDVAEVRLPEAIARLQRPDAPAEPAEVEPIGIDSRDEIGDVAETFDQLHREAVRLASEQAGLRRNVNDMFVNLSRRSQGLVERQLKLIDELETGEQDPDQLANLFKLDHLATRMRRNSENLLVLAGEDAGRRWGRPIPLVDVLRAATSEVEQYHRIQLTGVPDVEVMGHAVDHLVHLVAELLENATVFSSPESKVLVHSQRLSDGGAMVEIEDRGIGMSAHEISDSNERLAKPPEFDVSVVPDDGSVRGRPAGHPARHHRPAAPVRDRRRERVRPDPDRRAGQPVRPAGRRERRPAAADRQPGRRPSRPSERDVAAARRSRRGRPRPAAADGTRPGHRPAAPVARPARQRPADPAAGPGLGTAAPPDPGLGRRWRRRQRRRGRRAGRHGAAGQRQPGQRHPDRAPDAAAGQPEPQRQRAQRRRRPPGRPARGERRRAAAVPAAAARPRWPGPGHRFRAAADSAARRRAGPPRPGSLRRPGSHPRRPGAGAAGRARSVAVRRPTVQRAPAGGPEERTPIFEQLQSEWFRQRPAAARPAAQATAATQAPAAAPRSSSRSARRPRRRRRRRPRPPRRRGPPRPTRAGGRRSGCCSRPAAAPPAPACRCGCRRPISCPVARTAPAAAPPEPVRPAYRSPEAVRSRLASYHQGVRRGRHADRADGVAGNDDNGEHDPSEVLVQQSQEQS